MTHDSASATTGFTMVPNWMLDDERVTGHMVMVYLALGTYADRGGLAYPGIPALAKRARMGATACREAIRGLEALGLVQVTERRLERGQTSNLYRIAVHEGTLTPSVRRGGPLREAEGPPPSGGDEQEPLNKNHLTTPLQAPQGAEPAAPLDGLEEPTVDVDHFSVFWEAYPRKVEKPRARRAWTKALKGGTHWSVIVGAAMAYAEDPNREAAFTKHPSTWLNAEAWNDGPLPERTPAPAAPGAFIPGPAPRTMSERVVDCADVGRQHRTLPDGSCMLCEVRPTG